MGYLIDCVFKPGFVNYTIVYQTVIVKSQKILNFSSFKRVISSQFGIYRL